MAKTSIPAQKQILKEGKLQTRQGAIWDQGLGVITQEYFYFQARGGTGLSIFGLLGTLLRMALPVKVKVSVPLTSITAIGRGRIGLVRDVFFIETIEEKKYQFRLNYQSWLEALTNALQTHTGATLTQNGEDRWTVLRA